MCGIIGGIGKNLNHRLLDDSTVLLNHRGPNASRKWKSQNCWLGHTRLSILDLNERSNQPFTDYVDKCILVFNGEIYNFQELRTTLLEDGISFKTNSDTEVILHSWRKWGKDCFNKFKGMFALAIWNPLLNELILARDRFGEKPLYYISEQNRFYFASELSTISKFLNSVQLDPLSINDYFYWGYIASPNCLIKGVKKLKPGHYGIFKENSYQEIQYYKKPAQLAKADGDQIQSQVRYNLSVSVQRALVADVPVGLSLSGGIDSCAIAALAKKEFDTKLKCISIGYKGRPKSDERERAEVISKKFDHEFHEVEISLDDIKNNFESFAKALDEPVSDIAGFSYYSVFKKSQDIGLKAILSGIGGDEFFWGYPIHNRHCMESQRRQFFRYFIPKKFWSTFHKGYYGWTNQIMWNSGKMISENPQSFLSINESILEERLPYYTLTKRKCENWAQATQRVLIESWLEGNCLTLNDRLSMHYSVECRSPFLDADLTDHALSIETDKKILLATKKHLKLALTKDLPDSILSAPKSGFTPPVNLWKKSICENFQGEYKKCKVLHDFIKIENIDKQDFDLYYKLIIISFVINKLITN